MKKVLFIYAVEEGFGIVAKAKKIEEGFVASGCNLVSLGFIIPSNKAIRIFKLLYWHFLLLRTIVKGFDITFIRHSYYFLFAYLLVPCFGKKLQIEVNTKEREEYLLKNQPTRAKLSMLALDLGASQASRLHTVTHELVSYYQTLYPKVEISYNPNFVVDEYYHKRQPEHSNITNLVFLGSAMQPWQRVDMFIENIMVNNDWFLKHCRLHIIGHPSKEIEDLVDKYSLSNVVISYGYLTGNKKKVIMDKMHIGLGVFNLKAKKMTEATPIKVGEFLYSGLAVIIGYSDSRLAEHLPFVLKINMSDSPSVLQQNVNEFISSFRSNSSLHDKAHQYALEKMLVSRYIEKILS